VIKISLVDKNFSRTPQYYHNQAECQSYVSSVLADFIEKGVSEPKRILEIGAGTGFLTEKIFSSFPDAKFDITDLSLKMVEYTSSQTESLRKELKIDANFFQQDVTQISLDNKYDLIVSSLAFQWLDELSNVVKNLKQLLTSNGQIIFSTLTKDTFSSAKKIFDSVDVVFPEPKLLTSQNIYNILHTTTSFNNDLDDIQALSKTAEFADTIYEEIFVENYDSMLDFLRHIQGTGAGNASGSPISHRDLKRVLQKSKNTPIAADYHICYAIASRY